jgi:epoxyqueuosine reductase
MVLGTADQISAAALALGFVRVGFSPVERFERGRRALSEWLARGYHGSMAYLAGPSDRSDPAELLDRAETLVVVAMAYRPASLVLPGDKAGEPLRARIAGYALGTDYHPVMKRKLYELADRSAAILDRPVLARPCVDTAPLLEREAATRSGIGFAAKSTMTIIPGVGSYVLLGELLLDVAIAPGSLMTPGCGRCTACLDACPTKAFVAPYVLDARRCISYLTIEFRGVIPRELRALIGTRVFGCDVCQDVCPFNATERPHEICAELAPRAELSSLSLVELLELSASGYRRLTRQSALRRASRTQLARNAAVALGNTGDARAEPPLIGALRAQRLGLVRGHVAWALGRLGHLDPSEVSRALEQAAEQDTDPFVREEAAQALSDSNLD